MVYIWHWTFYFIFKIIYSSSERIHVSLPWRISPIKFFIYILFFKEAYKVLGFYMAFSNIHSVKLGKGSKLYTKIQLINHICVKYFILKYVPRLSKNKKIFLLWYFSIFHLVLYSFIRNFYFLCKLFGFRIFIYFLIFCV